MGKTVFVSVLPTSKKRLIELQDETANLTELFNWSTWPLGILSIQSYAQKVCSGLDSEIIDLNRTFLKKISSYSDYSEGIKEFVANYTENLMAEILEVLERENVEIFALSALFDISLSTLELIAAEIRKAAPNALIIAGGFPCTNFADKIIERNVSIDAVCLGEGEIPFAELVCAEDKFSYLNYSPYFVTKKHRGTTKGYIHDINEIPMFDYSGYIAKYGEEVLGEYVNVLKGGKGALGIEGIMMTGRGCPFRCVFCAAHSIHGRKMRYLTIERIKEEIDFWIDRYHVTTINISDDHFLGDVNRAIAIVDYIGSRERNVIFANTLSFASVTKEFVECIKRNEINEIHFALESGSARVLRDIMHKPITLKRVDEVLAMFDKTDIFVKIALLVGFPEETPDDIDSALKYLRTARYHWATISNLIPISGSQVYEQIVKNNGIEYDIDSANVFTARYANSKTVEYMLGDIKYTMNLDINFVHNPYMRMGKHALAAERFKALTRSYPDHAFAHYYLAKCYEQLGEDSQQEYLEYARIIQQQPFWKKYALHFRLEGV